LLSNLKEIDKSGSFDVVRYLFSVTGIISLLIISVSFFDGFSLQISPQCISIVQGGFECSMCGMTRSFISISNFDLPSAWSFNRAGLPVYTIFLGNAIYTLMVLFRYFKKRNKRG